MVRTLAWEERTRATNSEQSLHEWWGSTKAAARERLLGSFAGDGEVSQRCRARLKSKFGGESFIWTPIKVLLACVGAAGQGGA